MPVGKLLYLQRVSDAEVLPQISGELPNIKLFAGSDPRGIGSEENVAHGAGRSSRQTIIPIPNLPIDRCITRELYPGGASSGASLLGIDSNLLEAAALGLRLATPIVTARTEPFFGLNQSG